MSPSADGLLSLKAENDAFSAGGDRHYTNGIEGVWAFDPPEEHWTRSLAERLPGWSGSSLVGVTYRFGQQMYTPSNIEAEALIKDDRPYAGLVYGGVSLLNNMQHDGWRLAESLHLDVGIVGPASGAEALQKGAHGWIGSAEPRGWDNQLNNELVVNLAYQRAWVFQQELGGLDVEYGPSSGFALGNLYTYASSGLGLRWEDSITALAFPLLHLAMVGDRLLNATRALAGTSLPLSKAAIWRATYCLMATLLRTATPWSGATGSAMRWWELH